MRRAVTAAALSAALVGCAHVQQAPGAVRWGMPVYPGATLTARPSAQSPAASLAVYRSPDSVGDVYRWYLARLPVRTPHVYDAAKSQATFAFFDAQVRRTIHLQADGGGTSILLTRVAK